MVERKPEMKDDSANYGKDDRIWRQVRHKVAHQGHSLGQLRGDWRRMHDFSILPAHDCLLVRSAKPPRSCWIVERVISDHSMHFEHHVRRQR